MERTDSLETLYNFLSHPNNEDSFYSTTSSNYICIDDKLCRVYKAERVLYCDKGFIKLDTLKGIYPNYYIQLI